MASDSSDSAERGDSEGQGPASHAPRECMACRGSGRVISNLGGTAGELTCPWCEGSGQRQPGIDAQARWLAQRGEGVAAAQPAPPPG